MRKKHLKKQAKVAKNVIRMLFSAKGFNLFHINWYSGIKVQIMAIIFGLGYRTRSLISFEKRNKNIFQEKTLYEVYILFVEIKGEMDWFLLLWIVDIVLLIKIMI